MLTTDPFWRDISELTNEHMWEQSNHLLFGNSCNGPHKPSCEEMGERYRLNPDMVKQEGVWTHFAVVPKVPIEEGEVR
ncbi:MAG: hypothetical protein JJ902_03965 [Roseibium sp.]|nr:hypothetical protein [Roseibium sp.]